MISAILPTRTMMNTMGVMTTTATDRQCLRSYMNNYKGVRCDVYPYCSTTLPLRIPSTSRRRKTIKKARRRPRCVRKTAREAISIATRSGLKHKLQLLTSTPRLTAPRKVRCAAQSNLQIFLPSFQPYSLQRSSSMN